MTITLATLETATAQQVFDQVAEHLLTQARRSARDGLGAPCKYRFTADDGTELKCAAGCLIGDDEYDAVAMEDVDWEGVAENKGATAHTNLIWQLQVAHDKTLPDDWPEALRKIARRESLDAAIVDRMEESFLRKRREVTDG